MHLYKKVCYLKGGGTFVRAVNLNGLSKHAWQQVALAELGEHTY